MDLYNDQEFVRSLIISHATKPINKITKEILANWNNTKEAKTVTDSCTDDITIALEIKDDVIINAGFYGLGCAISTATTDMMCTNIKNKKINEVINLTNNYLTLTTNGKIINESLLNDMIIYKNVYKQANRIACAQSCALSINKILKELIQDGNN